MDAFGDGVDGAVLPTISLDIWFHVDAPALHRVVDLLPSLAWEGTLVGLRVEFAATDAATLLGTSAKRASGRALIYARERMVEPTIIRRHALYATWVERSLDNHKRKLQWAVWSPLVRIDPADFEAARQFAERAHAMRLASLYVDPKAESTDPPPRTWST